jgi:hypothetical protein
VPPLLVTDSKYDPAMSPAGKVAAMLVEVFAVTVKLVLCTVTVGAALVVKFLPPIVIVFVP